MKKYTMTISDSISGMMTEEGPEGEAGEEAVEASAALLEGELAAGTLLLVSPTSQWMRTSHHFQQPQSQGTTRLQPGDNSRTEAARKSYHQPPVLEVGPIRSR